MFQTTRPVCRAAPVLLVLLLLLLSVLPQSVWATEHVREDTIELTGTLSGKFELNSSDMELFSLTGMVPGDSWSGRLKVVNKTGTDMDVSLISIISNLEDNMLFEALDLLLLVDGDVVYSGSYGKTKSPITPKISVPENEPLVFDICVSLPASAGNEYQAKEMDSTWIFEANCASSENVQTGVDLTLSNSGNATWLLIAGLCFLCGLILLARIRAARKEMKQYDTSVKGDFEYGEK